MCWRRCSICSGLIREGCGERADQIVASDPGDKGMYFDPMEDKVYRHPSFYELPKSVDHM